MSSSFVIFLNPSEIENFTQESVAIHEDYDNDQDCFDDKADEVKGLLSKIPQREADMIYLYYFKKKFQADIGKIFKVSQGDVSYRIKRGVQRIKFLLDYPQIDIDFLIQKLSPILPYEDIKVTIPNIQPGELDFCGDNLYLRIMVGMYQTSSQSVVADILGIYQNRVRYRFLKGLEILEAHSQSNPEYDPIVKAFKMVSSQPNILRQLKVQNRWKHKFTDTFL